MKIITTDSVSTDIILEKMGIQLESDNIYYTKEIQDFVKLISNKHFFSIETDAFFYSVFPKLNTYDQAKVLSELQKNIKSFNLYLKRVKPENIISELHKGIDVLTSENEIDKCLELLPILLFYTSIDLEYIELNYLLKPFENMSFFEENSSLINNEIFVKILENIAKLITYAKPDSESYEILLNSDGYKTYEKIICDFINNLDDEEIIDNNLVNIVVETLPALSSISISNSLKNKFNYEVSLDKYHHYITNMIPVDFNPQILFDDVKRYRIKNGIIPENICIYINKFYNDNYSITRLCNIDLVRHYIIKNGIKDISVFLDESMAIGIKTKGIASEYFLAVKSPELNFILFHEATHVIQYNNQANNKNFTGYNYLLLKDNIIFKNMNPIVYDRNHNRFLFEIDADINGKRQYYNILEKIGILTEEDKSKREKIKEEEQFRLSLSNYLNVDGYNYEKGELFDSILLQNTSILVDYPVLQIEYNMDGTRRTTIEILKSLDEELSKGTRDETEIKDISSCIFKDSYYIKDIFNELDNLEKYTPNSNVLSQIRQKLIDELKMIEEKMKQ